MYDDNAAHLAMACQRVRSQSLSRVCSAFSMIAVLPHLQMHKRKGSGHDISPIQDFDG
jgi:hypothetical protein